MMEFLIIVLNRVEHLERILSIMVEAGAEGATILESEGLGHFLAYEVPIFAGLRKLMGEKKSANKTIIALVKKGFLDEFQQILKSEGIDFSKGNIGVMAVLPVTQAVLPSHQR